MTSVIPTAYKDPETLPFPGLSSISICRPRLLDDH